jgi:hypothetical protein
MLLDETGREISRHEGSERGPAIAPGTYLVSPEFDPWAMREVSVGPGESVTASFEASRSLWFTLAIGADRREQLLLHLRPEEELRALLRTYRPLRAPAPGWRDPPAFPRPEATPEQRARALDLARRWVADRRAAYKPDWTDASPAEARGWRTAERNAEAILAALGSAADVEETPPPLRAYIESRLGRLEDGVLARQAEDEPVGPAVTAAAVLAYYGVRTHEPLLIRMLAEDSDDAWPFYVVSVLLGSDDPGVLDAMRAVCERYAEAQTRFDEAKEAGEDTSGINVHRYRLAARLAIFYLLAYGDEDDWRTATKEMLWLNTPGDYDLPIAFSSRPERLIDLMMRHSPTVKIGRLVAVLRSHPAERADSLYEHARRRYVQRIIRVADVQERQTQRKEAFLYGRYWDFGASAHRPNEMTAGWYYRALGHEQESVLEPIWRWNGVRWSVGRGALNMPTDLTAMALNWHPEPGFVDEYVEQYISGEGVNANWERQLDYVDHATMREALRPYRGRSERRDFYIDLLLAYHRVATRQYLSWANPFPDGVERRPYLLRQPEDDGDFGGALSGVVEVRPSLEDPSPNEGPGAPAGVTLQLGVRIRQVPHYFAAVSGLALKIAKNANHENWDIHRYVENAGRALISDVWLYREGERTELRPVGTAEDGFDLYRAPLDQPGLSNLYAVVEFDFFGQRPVFIYDLFASDFARRL